jgi:hypothetical protein
MWLEAFLLWLAVIAVAAALVSLPFWLPAVIEWLRRRT